MSPESEGRVAAEQFRDDHHLGTQPLGDLMMVIEQSTGVDVAVLDAGTDEHGLTMGDPHRDTVFIGVARTRNPMRQRSTLAHELGHVVFADWAEPGTGSLGDRSPLEVRADAFARHLLIPIAGLREFLGQPARPATWATLSTVVQRYLVSPAIAAIAVHQAGYIDIDTKQEWMTLSTPQLAVRFGWSDQYLALQTEADQRRAPQKLLARAIRGYAEGLLSAQAIATLRGVAVPVVEEELRLAGIVPIDRSIPWAEASQLPEIHVDWAALDEDLNAPTPDESDQETERDKQ